MLKYEASSKTKNLYHYVDSAEKHKDGMRAALHHACKLANINSAYVGHTYVRKQHRSKADTKFIGPFETRNYDDLHSRNSKGIDEDYESVRC